MQTPTTNASPSGLHLFWRLLLWGGGCVLAGVLLVAFEILHAGTDVTALRRGLVKEAETEWRKQIQIGVGPLTLGLARTGLAFVNLPSEARAALSAVRSAEVSINEWQGTDGRPDHHGMLARAEATMGERGWDRVVGVTSKKESVAIYVPRKTASKHNLRVCLVVVEDRQMVLVAARINPEPLLALVNELQLPRPDGSHFKFTRGVMGTDAAHEAPGLAAARQL